MPKTEQRLFYSAAPIVIAAFDDAPSLKRTLEDLARCSDATATKVVIYIDGPRNERDKPYVIQTINAAINAQGFRRRLVIKMEQHLGRGLSRLMGQLFWRNATERSFRSSLEQKFEKTRLLS